MTSYRLFSISTVVATILMTNVFATADLKQESQEQNSPASIEVKSSSLDVKEIEMFLKELNRKIDDSSRLVVVNNKIINNTSRLVTTLKKDIFKLKKDLLQLEKRLQESEKKSKTISKHNRELISKNSRLINKTAELLSKLSKRLKNSEKSILNNSRKTEENRKKIEDSIVIVKNISDRIKQIEKRLSIIQNGLSSKVDKSLIEQRFKDIEKELEKLVDNRLKTYIDQLDSRFKKLVDSSLTDFRKSVENNLSVLNSQVRELDRRFKEVNSSNIDTKEFMKLKSEIESVRKDFNSSMIRKMYNKLKDINSSSGDIESLQKRIAGLEEKFRVVKKAVDGFREREEKLIKLVENLSKEMIKRTDSKKSVSPVAISKNRVEELTVRNRSKVNTVERSSRLFIENGSKPPFKYVGLSDNEAYISDFSNKIYRVEVGDVINKRFKVISFDSNSFIVKDLKTGRNIILELNQD